jgi:hypothetical protein
MKSYWLLIIISFAFLTGSCSPMKEIPTPSEEPVTSRPEIGSPTPDVTPTPDPATLQLAIRARNDLALKLGIRVDDISIASAQAVSWPDSSLGCPQPGMAYSQVVTPGYLIQLEANGKMYEYHAGRGNQVIYCENPTSPVPGTPTDT